MPKDIVKCGFEGSKTLPRLPKIEPGATKKATNMSQKSARSVQEPAKSEKKAPKSEKCANMSPTWSINACGEHYISQVHPCTISKWAYAQTAALEGCFIVAGEEVSGV